MTLAWKWNTVNTWSNVPLREKCPNTELFLVRIFSRLDWIRRDTPYLSVFSPNAGKYGPEITPYLDTFHTVCFRSFFSLISDDQFIFSIPHLRLREQLNWNRYKFDRKILSYDMPNHFHSNFQNFQHKDSGASFSFKDNYSQCTMTSITVDSWYSKTKMYSQTSDLTKHFYTTTSTQKIPLLHLFIFEIQ